MAKPLIRHASPNDLEAILQIEKQCFASPNWTAKAFAQYSTVVAEMEEQIVGVLVTRQTYQGDNASPAEIEILNLAVAPDFRRQGIASSLLTWILLDPAVFFLEVRLSNHAAQELYRKFHFQEIGQRSGYYDHPPESALVMQLKKC